MHVVPALALLTLGASAFAESIPARFSRAADAAVAEGLTPGISIGLFSKGGEPIIVTRGQADLATGQPFRVTDWHRIGSVTKSFTVTRIYQLADAGRLSLADPIAKYVPGLRNGSATLRQLANMTSGIFDYTENPTFRRRLVRDLTRRWTDRQLVAAGNARPPYFPPGRGWHYSNTNTVLLGMVVERVTGRPLAEELRRGILEPLRLTRTRYPRTPALPRPYHHGYQFDAESGEWVDFTRISPSGLSGAGALLSTAGDMARWGRALARGSLLSPAAQADRLRMVPADGPGPFYDQYGPGIGKIGGWIGHTGSVPGYQTLVMHNLRADQTLVIFVNTQIPEPNHLPTAIFRRLLPYLPSARP